MEEEKLSLTSRIKVFFLSNLFAILYDEMPRLEILTHRTIFNIQNFFDPLPKQKKKELTSEWVKRIEPKYAIRYTKFMYETWRLLDNTYSTKIRLGGLERHRKKDKKVLSDLANSIKGFRYQCEVNYNAALDRKEALGRS